MEIMTWVLTISCIIGAVFNAKKNIIGFYVWVPANFLWAYTALRIEQYAQAALFGVYTIIAIIGIINWKASSKDAERKKNDG